jgi:hypothetical protein
MPLQSEFGSSDLENVVADVVMKTVEYKQSDMVGNVLTIPVMPGTIVLGIGHEVKTAFSGGATPTVTIGDGTTVALFAASAEIVPGTVNTFAMKMVPKKFTAAGKIVVTAHADVTAGAGKLFVLYANLNGTGRIPNL